MRREVLDHGWVELVDSMPGAEAPVDGIGPGDKRILESARVSIAGENVKPVSTDKRLIRYLWVNKHMTPFESVKFTFRVKCPIFVARQWMRHRAGSFNEMSARYGALPQEYYVPTPERCTKQSTDNKQASSGEVVECPEHVIDLMQDAYKYARVAYSQLLISGVSRELARAVLPVGIYTKFYWTVDLRNLLAFIQLRDHHHAQHEIAVYARGMLDLIGDVVPHTLAVFKETTKP